MTEHRNDLVLRIIDQIAFLSARMTGLWSLGLSEEITREIERLEQAAGRLDPEDRERVREPLERLRRPAGPGP